MRFILISQMSPLSEFITLIIVFTGKTAFFHKTIWRIISLIFIQYLFQANRGLKTRTKTIENEKFVAETLAGNLQ